MGIKKTSLEFKSSISPSTLFKALVTDCHNIAPKAAPQSIKSIEVIEENGVKFSITNCTDEAPFKMFEHRFDSIDIANYATKFTLIDGDVIDDKLEKITYDSKIEASYNGGSVLKQIIEYHTKGGFDLTEEKIKHGNEQAKLLFKATEAYLIANPNVCA